MRRFAEIVGAIGVDRVNPAELRDNITVTYNRGGGGYQASLIFEDGSGNHLTLYQNSWDGSVDIPDYSGDQVSIGPYCLHLTTPGGNRWFRQYIDGSWMFVTDYGTPSSAVLTAINNILNRIDRYFDI